MANLIVSCILVEYITRISIKTTVHLGVWKLGKMTENKEWMLAVVGQPLDAVFWLKMVGVVVAGAMLIFVIFLSKKIFDNNNKTIERNHIIFVGILAFLPTIVILGIVVGLPGEALAALLGTFAGYIFSRQNAEQKTEIEPTDERSVDDKSSGKSTDKR